MTFKVRDRIEQYRRHHPVDWSLLEQDYALSWVLFGMSEVKRLKDHLVFKGGTCLKKCYFGEYRFSQDLDFSVQGESPVGDELELLINKACQVATQTLASTHNNVTFQCKRYVEKKPHPDNQEAFSILVQYPWQQEPLTRVMVEVTLLEVIYLPIQERSLIHGYGDEIQASIHTYSLEEIIAEKIAALLSYQKKLHERGWGRSRARDYYDLWRIFHSYRDDVKTDTIPDIVKKKCQRKGVLFTSFQEIFSETLLADLETSWTQWVRPLVTQLPDREAVIRDLKEFLTN